MKDVDRSCRYIGPLTYRYRVDAATMRSKDNRLRSFTYNFDIF